MNKLDELYEKAAAASRNRKEVAQKNVDEILSVIFAELPKLNLIRVRGETPGFNDGDPCTHSQTVAVDVYDPDELYHDLRYGDEEEQAEAAADLNLSGELLKWSHSTWDSKTNKSKDNPLPDDPHHAGCIKALTIVNELDVDFATLFDTNFNLDITRDPDSKLGFSISVSDYDCGY